MKHLIVAALALMSVAAIAGERSPSETISRIERDTNVKCDLIKNSFSVCIGTPREIATCRYTKTYSCYGLESFQVKMKVKDFYNYSTNSRETVVTNISYK